jgi:hypothetical protein
MSDDKTRELILATARELYGRAVWTHKVHEKEREIWSTKACSMNRWGIGLACVTTILAVVSVALQPKIILILTAVSAAASTGFALWHDARSGCTDRDARRVRRYDSALWPATL